MVSDVNIFTFRCSDSFDDIVRCVGGFLDISMCDGEGCPLKYKCHRYTGLASSPQWYVEFERKEDGSCEHFWDNLDRAKDPEKMKVKYEEKD